MNFRTWMLSALALPILAACAPESSVGHTEQDATDDDALGADTVYVVTRQDFRKCAYPMCGGVFIKAVNKAKTKCFDGTKQSECYVADVDESPLGLTGKQADEVSSGITAGSVLVSGQLEPVDSGHAGFGKLVAYKAFAAETGNTVSGGYFTLEPSGITCIKAPCPSLRARKLNTTSVKQVTDVDMSALGLTDEEASAFMAVIYEKNLVVSGSLKNVSSPEGVHRVFKVSEIFSTVEALPSQQLCLSDDACGDGEVCDHSECLSGCAPGEICAAVCYGACTSAPVPKPGS